MKSKRWRIKNFNIAKSKVGNDKPRNFLRIHGIFKFTLPLVECPYVRISLMPVGRTETQWKIIKALFKDCTNVSYEKMINKVVTVVMLELFDAFLAACKLAK